MRSLNSILITGGAGYVGSKLVEFSLKKIQAPNDEFASRANMIFDKLKKTNGHSKEQHSYGTISKINTDSTSIPKLEHNFPDTYNDLDEEENNETKEYDENAELDGYPTDIEDDDDFHYLDYSDQEEIDSL